VCAALCAGTIEWFEIEGVAMDRGGRLFNWAPSVGRIRLSLVLLLMLCKTLPAMSGVETRAQRDAVRLNNIGTDLLSQQILVKAIDKYDESHILESLLTTDVVM